MVDKVDREVNWTLDLELDSIIHGQGVRARGTLSKGFLQCKWVECWYLNPKLEVEDITGVSKNEFILKVDFLELRSCRLKL